MTAPPLLRVIVVDPGAQVVPYDLALVRALRRTGCDATLLTAPDLRGAAKPSGEVAGAVQAEVAFARPLAEGGPIGPAAVRWTALRRSVRAACYPADLRGLVRRAVADQVDVVHFQWSLSPYQDARAFGALKRAGVAVVFTAHNVLPHEPRPWHRAAYRALYRLPDRLIVHSEAASRRLLAVGGASPDRVDVIPMPAFSPTDGAGEARYGRPTLAGSPEPGRPTVLFFGHVRPYKGLDVLLEAMPMVLARVPRAWLVVAGSVHGGRKAEAALRDRVRVLGLSNAVDVRPGYRPEAELDLLLEDADVVCLPYRAVDDSAVLARALAHGRAVVASRVGGLPEALATGGGLAVPSGDPRALAEALVAVLGGPTLREALEAGARARAQAWTWDDAARRTREVYRLALARRRSPVARRGRDRGASPGAGRLSQTDATVGSAVPRVTVVLPVLNGARSIRSSLEALLAGDYPSAALEVLVVDGGSTDGTRQIVEAIARRDDRVRVLDNPSGTTSAGLNIGIAAAAGDTIVRLDAHAVPAPDYVHRSVDALARTGAWAVGGPMRTYGDTGFGRAVAAAHQTLFGSGGAAYRAGGEGAADTVYLGAWPRWVFGTVGGFDEQATRNQDAELCLRIRRAGGLVWLDPRIATRTLARGTPRGLGRQYFGYGAGRARTAQRHPGSLALRQILPAGAAAVAVTLAAAAPVSGTARRALFGLGGAYVAAVALSAASVARRHGPKTAAMSALAYPIMHGAWATGFWSGALRERLARRRG